MKSIKNQSGHFKKLRGHSKPKTFINLFSILFLENLIIQIPESNI